jgi:hypothetical protein
MNKSISLYRLLLVGTLTGSILPLYAQAAQQSKTDQAPVQVGSAAKVETKAKPATNDSSGWHARQGAYYKRNWGVDIVDVRRVASGEMLAFRYVVIDPEKAKALNDKRNTAYLIDEKSGLKLMVPQMEKVGALRTTVTPTAGRMYWMVFANTGRIVDVGSRVDLVIGDFHAIGLTVDAKQ